MEMLIPGNECNGLFLCGLNLIEDVLTVCIMFVLYLFRQLGCDQCWPRDTIVSIFCQREWRGEQRAEPGEPARRFCPLSLLSQHRLATGDCGQAELSSL